MISEEKEFLFIHRGKSGGNSLTKLLLPYCKDERIIAKKDFQDGIKLFDVINMKYNIRKHASIKEVKDTLPEHLFNRLFKFSIIRNPYDRLISAYWSPNRVRTHNITSFDENEFIEVINSQRTFREFVCINDGDTFYTHLDYIIKFENYKNSVKKLFKNINIPFKVMYHINKSKREHYSNYITPKIKQLIDQKFEEEINFFNYTF